MKNINLTREQRSKWVHNMLVFLAPLGVIYCGSVVMALQVEGHVFSLKDFIPTSFTIGAMVLYIMNTLYDLSRKLVEK